MGENTQRRIEAVQRFQAAMLRQGHPYWQLFFFLLATALAGFLASVALLALGVTSMAVRYPIAVVLAYLAFLTLLWLWLSYHRAGRRRAGPPPDGASGYVDWYYFDFGPGPGSTGNSAAVMSSSSDSKGGWNFDLGGGGGGGSGDGAAVVIVIVLILVALVAGIMGCLYVLMEAPALLAEAFVDGVLIVGLARRVRPRRAPHWVVGVVRRTWLPVVVVAVIFALVGSLLQQVQPGARTLAEALHQAQHR